MNFKTGDWVKVKGHIGGLSYCYELVPSMLEFAGTCQRIKEITRTGEIIFEGSIYRWEEGLLEPISKKEELHIMRDGDTIHALYKVGEEIIRTHVKCESKDGSDFEDKAQLTMEQAFAIRNKTTDSTKECFDFDKFKSGKQIVNCVTKREAEIFLAFLYGKGIKFARDASLKDTRWENYGTLTCYRCEGTQLSYCSTSYYKMGCIPIIPFCQDDL